MANETIPTDKLPYDQFKLLGMEKKDVLSLPKPTMQALLSGNRTTLIQFNNLNINGVSEPITINARLSMQQKGDSYELKMHPVNLTPKNNLDLSQKEIEFLEKDPLNILPKMVVGNDGKLVDSFVSLDKATNEFVAVKRDSIKSPESINDVNLNESQKADFANGKPVQIGKDKYQLDVNSEQGVAGENLKKIKFQSGEYNSYNMLADAALIVSGLGILVLLEHLAKMTFNNIYGNKEPIHELLKQDLKPAIKRTIATIAEKATNGKELNNEEKNELFVVNLKDTTIIDRTDGIKNEPAATQSVSEQQKFTYEGKLEGYGHAPYEFNKDNKDNYFVKLGTEAGEKIIWGIDLARSIPESNATVGDKIGINYEGNKPVNVTTDIKDKNGIVTGQETKVVNRNTWDVQRLDVGLKLSQEQKVVRPISKVTQPKTSIISPIEHDNKQPKNIKDVPNLVEKNIADAPSVVNVIPLNENQIKQIWESNAWKDSATRKVPLPELTKEQIAAIPDKIDNIEIQLEDKFKLLSGEVLGDLDKGATYSISEDKTKIERFSLHNNDNANTLKNSYVLQNEVQFNSSKIDSLKVHISNETATENKAEKAFNADEIKIIHPEQRNVGETKASLKSDETNQLNISSKASTEIKKDIKKIVKQKKGVRW